MTELVDELRRETPGENLADVTIVLPTKRLANWFLAMMAAKAKAFYAPHLITFEELIVRSAAACGYQAATRRATPLTIELLLTDLLSDRTYKHLSTGHAHEIQQFLKELAEWGLRDEAFGKLRAVIDADSVRSEASVAGFLARFDELENLAERLDDCLARRGEELGAAHDRKLALAAAAHVESADRLAPGRLYAVGFTSLGGHHHHVFRALGARTDVAIWMSEPPDGLGGEGPLAKLRSLVPDGRVQIRTSRAPVVPGKMAIYHAETVLAECAFAVDLVNEGLGLGMAPSHIAILVTDDTMYGTSLRRALASAPFGRNAALALPLGSTALGGFLQAFAGVIGAPESPEAILDLLSHPFTMKWLASVARASALKLPKSVSRAAIATALTYLEMPTPITAWRPQDPSVYALVRAACEALADFLGNHGGPPPRRRSLSEWSAALRTTLMPVVEADTSETAGRQPAVALLERAAKTSALVFLDELVAASSGTSGLFSARSFFGLVAPRLLALDVRDVGEQLEGVQVLSVAEARYVPFQFAVVLGAAEGTFPRALPKDHLVDQWLKTRLGLPGWSALERIEDTTFHLLKERLPAIALTYPERAGDEASVRSRFVEALVQQSGLLDVKAPAATLPPLAPVRRAEMQGELLAREAVAGLTAASITPPAQDGAWSATSIEDFLRCPYRLLLKRLGVRDAVLPSEGDTRREGTMLHSVLEAFFTGESGGQKYLSPIGSPAVWSGFETFVVERLRELSRLMLPAAYLASAEGLELELKSWPAFAAHLARLYNDESWQRAKHGWREFAFGRKAEPDLPPPELKPGLVLKGKIDSVDRLPGQHVITDYKRMGMPGPKEVARGISPQLAVYAAALAARKERLPLAEAVVGYWSILGGRWLGAAAGESVRGAASDAKLVSPKSPALESLVEDVKTLFTWRENAIGAQGGAQLPDRSACGYCDFEGVCRKEDGNQASKGAPHWTSLTRHLAALALERRAAPQEPA